MPPKRKTKSPPKTNPMWHRGYARGYSEASKAFGGCDLCFGKGYATVRYGFEGFPDFEGDPGVMVTDRGRSDDAQTFDHVDQQKCLAHTLRSINDVVERKTGRARDFGAQLKACLQEALALWHRHREDPVAEFKVEAEALQAELTHQLRNRRLKDRDNQRLLNELGWHHDRGNVLRFLTDPRIEPTNNRAEQALRPAVIARQVSHCSRNDAGAHAFATFISVVRTLAKQGMDSMVENLYQLFRGPDVQATPS
jgi:Transposase IS66 family